MFFGLPSSPNTNSVIYGGAFMSDSFGKAPASYIILTNSGCINNGVSMKGCSDSDCDVSISPTSSPVNRLYAVLNRHTS